MTEDVAFALFFRPRPGGFDSTRVLTPGNLPSKAKKVLMPGDQPGGEGGWGAGRRWNWLMHLFLVFVFPFVCCLTAMAILQNHTWTFEVSTSCCCFFIICPCLWENCVPKIDLTRAIFSTLGDCFGTTLLWRFLLVSILNYDWQMF